MMLSRWHHQICPWTAVVRYFLMAHKQSEHVIMYSAFVFSQKGIHWSVDCITMPIFKAEKQCYLRNKWLKCTKNVFTDRLLFPSAESSWVLPPPASSSSQVHLLRFSCFYDNVLSVTIYNKFWSHLPKRNKSGLNADANVHIEIVISGRKEFIAQVSAVIVDIL